MQKKVLILDNIRSSENVGALFRTADAIGITKMYLGGYTPAPIDRFGREQEKIKKAALGAEETVVWEKVEDTARLVENLKEEGVQIVALEQTKDSVHYKEIIPQENCALILGNEVSGVSKELLDLSDITIEIPMRGQKESLNVSTAGGIALYQLFDR